MESKCAVCDSEANHKCSGCKKVFYCSKLHQKQAWKKHKTVCKSFKVCENAQLGRYVVATRQIRAGEVIICEPPLIWGPSQMTGPVCLTCGQHLDPSNCISACVECGWLMCNSDTCKIVSPAHLPECEYTKARGNKVFINNFIYPHPNYECITALRILYQRDNNKDLWDKLMKLESHCEERKRTDSYESDRESVAKFIQKFFKLENSFSEDEIMRVCGIIQVNSHEVPLSEPPYVAIFEQTSMFEHNCRSNCSKSFTSKGEVLISAAVNIEPGDHLSICYTDSMWGTVNRRHFLHETKFFMCSCARCQDPTENGTYFGALRCTYKDCSGYMLPETFIVDPNMDHTQPWKCMTCKREVSATFIQTTLDRIGEDLNVMRKDDAKSCELFLSYYSKLLHPNHYYMTDVNVTLAHIIGQNAGGLVSVSDADLSRKLKLCTQLVQLIEKLDPAEIRLRGTLLFELHAAVAETARRRATSGCADTTELRAMLLRSKEILVEAIRVLQHEPSIMPEGKIALQAKKNLHDIDNLLKNIQDNTRYLN